MAVAVFAPAATVKPSQRHKAPSRPTNLWPTARAPQSRRPSPSVSTTPICDNRRASADGARTTEESGFAPSGKAGGASRGGKVRHEWGRLVGRGREVFAQGRAERHLVTVLDGNGVDELREKFRIRVVQQFGEGVFFRLAYRRWSGPRSPPLELRSIPGLRCAPFRPSSRLLGPFAELVCFRGFRR